MSFCVICKTFVDLIIRDEPATIGQGYQNRGYLPEAPASGNRNFNNGQNRLIGIHSTSPVTNQPNSSSSSQFLSATSADGYMLSSQQANYYTFGQYTLSQFTSKTISYDEGSSSVKSSGILSRALSSQTSLFLPAVPKNKTLSDGQEIRLLLNRILDQAKQFVDEIRHFEELEDSNKYYYIEESLKRLVDQLDNMFDRVKETEDLRNERKKVYKFIFRLLDELDDKVEENKKKIQGHGIL